MNPAAAIVINATAAYIDDDITSPVAVTEAFATDAPALLSLVAPATTVACEDLDAPATTVGAAVAAVGAAVTAAVGADVTATVGTAVGADVTVDVGTAVGVGGTVSALYCYFVRACAVSFKNIPGNSDYRAALFRRELILIKVLVVNADTR